MTDAKMAEAIALARRIESGELNDPWSPSAAASMLGELAEALLSATSPGTEYRAGMETAAETLRLRMEEVTAQFRKGAGDFLWGSKTEAETCYLAIRAAIAALPVSPDPAPVAVLRWEGNCLMTGGLALAEIYHFPRAPEGRQWEADIGATGDHLGSFATEPEARAAVEAAVREALGS